jgi:hypothetical protein
VTSPTTIKAITEIPANTARPIGRTESVFPGIWNAAAGLGDAESACEVAEADGVKDVGVPAGFGLPPAAFAGTGVDPAAEDEADTDPDTDADTDEAAALAEVESAGDVVDGAAVPNTADEATEETPCRTNDQY